MEDFVSSVNYVFLVSAGGRHSMKNLQLLHLYQMYTHDKKTHETTLQYLQTVTYTVIEYIT